MKPSLGRIVLYRMPDGQDRPAMIVRVWSDTCVNLQVFTDGENDAGNVLERMPGPFPGGRESTSLHVWRTSVMLAPAGAEPPAFSWRWPERV